jgi:hypothetical protein
MNIGDVVKSSEFSMHSGESVEKIHVVAETRIDTYGDLQLRLDPPGPEPSGNQVLPDDEPGWTPAFRVELLSKVQK